MGAAVWRSLSARERVLDELFDHRNDVCLLFASRRRTLLAAFTRSGAAPKPNESPLAKTESTSFHTKLSPSSGSRAKDRAPAVSSPCWVNVCPVQPLVEWLAAAPRSRSSRRCGGSHCVVFKGGGWRRRDFIYLCRDPDLFWIFFALQRARPFGRGETATVRRGR